MICLRGHQKSEQEVEKASLAQVSTSSVVKLAFSSTLAKGRNKLEPGKT